MTYEDKKLNVLIYVHNFGKFDSIFLFRNLVNTKYFKNKDIKLLIDKSNSFISLQMKHIFFKDSLRLSRIGGWNRRW